MGEGKKTIIFWVPWFRRETSVEKGCMDTILVSYGWCTNYHKLSWLKTTHVYYSIVLEARNLEWVSLGWSQGVSRAGSFWRPQGTTCFFTSSASRSRPPAFLGLQLLPGITPTSRFCHHIHCCWPWLWTSHLSFIQILVMRSGPLR